MGAELTAVKQDLSRAQAEKSRAEDRTRQVQALQESLQRQLAEVTEQLQSEQLRSSDLEAQIYKMEVSMQVC